MDKFVSTKQKQQKILDENITNKQKKFIKQNQKIIFLMNKR